MNRKKNEEYKESQITTINIFCFIFFIKNYSLLESIVRKKSSLDIPSCFICSFCACFCAEYLKPNNDTPKFNIHKYTNYNIIKNCINRLSTTT